MSDHDKTNRQLQAEVQQLRQRVAALESLDQKNSHRTEAMWHAVVSNAPVFVALVDGTGTLTFLNRAQPGLTVSQSIGRKVFDYTQPAYHEVLRKCLQGAFERGESGDFTSVAAGPNGKDAWYRTYVVPVVVDGKAVSATFIAADITNQKMAEQRLNQERSRAQTYLDIAAVILVALDKNGNIDLLNRSGRELLQYREGELIGKSWFEYCLPEHIRDQVRLEFHRLMADDGKFVKYYENPVITRSGEERIIAWHNTILTDEAGARVGTLSSGTDITQRKQAEPRRGRRTLNLRNGSHCEPPNCRKPTSSWFAKSKNAASPRTSCGSFMTAWLTVC